MRLRQLAEASDRLPDEHPAVDGEPMSGFLCGRCRRPLPLGALACPACATAVDELAPIAAAPGGNGADAPMATYDIPAHPRGRAFGVMVGIASLLAVAVVVGFLLGRATPDTPAAPVPASTSTAATVLSEKDRLAAFCTAAHQFRVDDFSVMARHALDAPEEMAAAFNAMVVYAPADLAAYVKAQQPAIERIKVGVLDGKVKTPEDLQQVLATVPLEDVQAWVVAQQLIVPAVAERC